MRHSGVVNEVLDLLLDTKHIAGRGTADGVRRWKVWRAYMRLKRLRLLRTGPGEVGLLGFRVRYLEPANVAQLFHEIFVRRLYDVALTSTAPTIIDCGSNIGMSILFLKSKYPRATVIGFEPNPLTYPVLRQNVEQNGLRDVILHQTAVAEEPGSIEFHLNADLNAGLYGVRSRNATAVSVHADRLSSYIDGDVDLLKLDVEGAEEMVIRDLAEQGKLRRLRSIVCEYHHHHHRDGGDDRLSVILSTLERSGFGYHLDAYSGTARATWLYQDVLIYAYRKG
jgi:FkbM family methyltransferase